MSKSKIIITLLLTIIFSLLNIGIVKADTKNIVVDSVDVKEKSGTITVVDPVIDENNITSNITFNEVDDFVTFELKIKNNELDKYKIESIKDNNTNQNIKIEYNHDEDYINTGETTTVTIKLTYKNKLLNVEKINLNNLVITINLINDKGETSEIILNPKTGDTILHYLVLLIIALIGLIFIRVKNKKKLGSLLMIFAIVMIPFAAIAKETYKINVKFTDIVIKGEFEKYNITIDPKNGDTPTTKVITYGDSIGELPSNPTKEGYTFDKWEDSDGNEVTEDTVITKPTDITAKYNAIEYTITYDLDGGSASNPSKYTIEDEITLNNPIKSGYTFSGWTGSNGDTLQTSVTISSGSTGNKNYKANYSVNDSTEYTVTHRYQNLDGTYSEEVVTEHGVTDTEVAAPLKEKTGFVNPTVQNVTIAGDGSSSVIYTYDREQYAFSVTDRAYIDSSSTLDGTYPYETQITVKAQERDGYTFKWSDNDINYERTFKIDKVTNLTPIYTPNTDTPYVVKHELMNLDGTTYTDKDVLNKTGTTDTEVTPSVNTYEGFTSPAPQTVIIKGDGSTIVEYKYTRNKVRVTVTNSEYIEEGDISGDYYYGEEITLTAKDIEGKTFTKWSNDEPTKEITITVGTSDIEIGPMYSGNELTVSFNTNGGSEVASQTVTYGEKATRPSTDPTKENYTFDNWYTTSSYETLFDFNNTITVDTVIYAKFNKNKYTVTFNSNGGGNVDSITVDAGETIQSFTTPTAPSGKVFDGWWTELSEGTKINTPYTPEADITLYAHWKSTTFDVVFSEPGECTFNGSKGVLTGDNCSYANGTNKYIDTGINLYNRENHDKDYEIGFTIVSYNSSEQVSQATLMNTKLEGNNYPGLVFRKRNNNTEFDLSSRKTSSANEVKYLSIDGVETVKIYRITNTDTGVQEIFYSINNAEKVKLNDLSSFNPEFDLSVWFGAAPTNASANAAQRILVNTTLKDMYIKLGTY